MKVKGTKIPISISKFVSKLSGDEDVMRRLWAAAGTGNPEVVIKTSRRKNLTVLIFVAFGLIVSIIFAASSGDKRSIESITRPASGSDAVRVEAEVSAEYAGDIVRKNVSINVPPVSVSGEETAAILEDLEKRLPNIATGLNESLAGVSHDLYLPLKDEVCGADISWHSEDERLIDANGQINHIEAKKGDRVEMTAIVRLGEIQREIILPVTVGDTPENYDYERDMNTNIGISLDDISQSEEEGSDMTLPKKTDGGMQLQWAEPRTKAAVILPVCFISLGIAVYRRRYRHVKKAIAEDRNSVGRDFPNFLDRLVLLLDAGVVVSSAIEKITIDYRERLRKDSYFREELVRMQERVKKTGSPLTAEFESLALRSGRREVMRFSAILADNIDKGSSLVDKLKQESDMLWDMRQKTAEKKGRIAETKLTFPMVLQLAAIILVTVAPAVLEMQ